MITKRLYIKLLSLTLVLMVICLNYGYSQSTDISSGKESHFYLGFSISPDRTSITNTGTSTILNLTSSGKGSLQAAIEAGYSFNKFFGISTGIGYSSYLTSLSLATYDNSYDTTDNVESYKRIISGTNIAETQKISFLSIPLMVNFQIPLNDNFGIYVQSGVDFLVPLKTTYSSSGTFTYTGYYKTYNVYITGLPYEGFEQGYKNVAEGDLKIKSFILELSTSAGATFTLQKKLQVSMGLMYCKMLSDISDYSSSASFKLSSFPDQMRSMMEGSTKTTASSIGLKIGLRYYLK